jgi:hypothetical protein
MAMQQMSRLETVILDRAQEIQAHHTALERARVMSDDWFRLYGQAINYHEMISQHAESVGAEIAVAEYFGIRGFNPSVNTFKSNADVGLNVEVKWTKYITGNLIVQASQEIRPNDVCILVVGRSPVYELIGWIPASMAMVPKYKHPRQPSWWIGQNNLFAMKYLKRSTYGQD